MNKPLKTRKASNLVEGERVTSVKHWTERLFSFRIERPQSFRFRSGEFVMIGLPGDNGKPLLRAYSVASPSWDDELEFYSIKVPDGPLTSRLQLIQPNDHIIMRPKPTGTLVLDALLPGNRLYMFATGTGIAPFASLIRDPETYEKFEQVILVHTCRTKAELAYGEMLVANLKSDPLIGEMAAEKLVHYTTLTQEDHPRQGRITARMQSGTLFTDLGVPQIDPQTDRAMICGSMGLNTDLKQQLNTFGLTEGANNRPAEFVLEKAFVG
ncbi:MAG: ferredoxin--NADP reductase [Sulfitobacter sp.]